MTNGNGPSGLGLLAQRVILSILKVQRAEEVVSALKKARDEAKDAMEAAFAEAGVTSVKYRGFTVYAYETIYGSLVNHTPTEEDGEQATKKTKSMKALKENDLGWMIKEGVAAQTLSAWVREQEKDEAGNPKLPEKLKQFIKVSRKSDIGVKRS